MARCPKATWRGEKSPRTPMSRYDVFCVHTIVGHDPADAAHFSTGADGTLWQSRDTMYRSAANLNGNHRVIACENEDWGPPFPDWGGDGRRVPPLTDAQIEANAQAYAWTHLEHGIPLQLCPDSRPGSWGLAYHRQGIDGNFLAEGYKYPGRVSGGEVWTEHPGKVCPGDARIAQLPTILARAIEIVTGEEDPMAGWLDDDLYAAKDKDVSARNVLQRLDRFLHGQAAYRKRLRTQIAAVRAAAKAGDADLDAKLDELLAAVDDDTDTSV